MSRPAAWLVLAAVAAAIVAAPFWANRGLVFLIGLTAVEALFALSWNFLFRFSGIASFGHATFFLVGGYTTGYILRQQLWGGLAFPGALLLSAAFGAACAFVIGLVALRRATGITFAIITLALSEIVVRFVGYSGPLGREDGLAGIPRPAVTLGPVRIDLSSDAAYYEFLVIACFLLALALWWVVGSEFGRAMRAISFDPQRATFLGIDISRYRVRAFALSGAIASLAGAIATPWTQIITPDSGNYVHSTLPMLNSLLGGFTFFWGGAVGAAFFAVISYLTRTLSGVSDLVTGGILLAVVLIAPTGLLGTLMKLGGPRNATRLQPLPRARRAAD